MGLEVKYLCKKWFQKGLEVISDLG